jgi:hypothetical protein
VAGGGSRGLRGGRDCLDDHRPRATRNRAPPAAANSAAYRGELLLYGEQTDLHR